MGVVDRFSALNIVVSDHLTDDPHSVWAEEQAIQECSERYVETHQGSLDTSRLACIQAAADAKLNGQPIGFSDKKVSGRVHEALSVQLSNAGLTSQVDSEAFVGPCESRCAQTVKMANGNPAWNLCRQECQNALQDKTLDAFVHDGKECAACQTVTAFEDQETCSIQGRASVAPTEDIQALSHQVAISDHVAISDRGTSFLATATPLAAKALNGARTVGFSLAAGAAVVGGLQFAKHEFAKAKMSQNKVACVAHGALGVLALAGVSHIVMAVPAPALLGAVGIVTVREIKNRFFSI